MIFQFLHKTMENPTFSRKSNISIKTQHFHENDGNHVNSLKSQHSTRFPHDSFKLLDLLIFVRPGDDGEPQGGTKSDEIP